MLTARQQEILKEIVHAHIETGDPVGSQWMKDRGRLKWSGATIRHIMVELEDLGYLTQPHASAGRVPTDKGFRFFVDSLLELDHLSEAEKDCILRGVEKGGEDLERTLNETAQAVANVTQYACLVVPPCLEQAVLMEIRFMQLSDGRIMAMVISASGQLHRRIFTLAESIQSGVLQDFGQMLSKRYRGMTLGEARDHLQKETEHDELAYRQLRRKILETFPDGSEQPTPIIVNGWMNLLNFREFSATTRLRDLLLTVEKSRILIKLLDSCLQSRGVGLFIGTEGCTGQVQGCTVVAARFAGPDQRVLGTLGVMGPTRLNYAHVIPLVDFTARTLSTALVH